jgi:transcriptional regulator with XRE-family HTH domain
MARMTGMYGSFIREIRESRGLSQGELADVVGISQPNLSAYERDRRVPTADTLNRLVVACGYQLVARAGASSVACPLPRVGWFPDEGDPPRLAGDPADEVPTVDVNTPREERAAVITAVLELAAATR